MAHGTLTLRGMTFTWGARTYVMGILNVTPDSFSGDGLLAGPAADPLPVIVAQARRMADEGADLLDLGGESTRPGHAVVGEAQELARVVPAMRAVRAALPAMPLSIDTTKAAVARAALDEGADLLNDVGAVGPGGEPLARLAAERGVPLIVMHGRAEPRYADVVAEVVADLRAALSRAMDLGVPAAHLIVDPGIGFGKTAGQNLRLLRELPALQALERPIMLGTSRKSTIGRVLDLPADERLEGTLATTALGIAAGVDIVRVHDVRANLRAARMADAIVRGSALEDEEATHAVSDRIVLSAMRFQGRHGVTAEERATPQPFEVDVELVTDLQPAGVEDDLAQTVDYAAAFEICRELVEATNFRLLEAIAEGLAHELLRAFPRLSEVVVRVRKLQVPLDGDLAYAEVEIRRRSVRRAPPRLTRAARSPAGLVPSVSCRSTVCPARNTVIVTVVPGWWVMRTSSRLWVASTRWPSTAVMMSPSLRPAFSAGLPATTAPVEPLACGPVPDVRPVVDSHAP